MLGPFSIDFIFGLKYHRISGGAGGAGLRTYLMPW
jgi:hypothetical protein